MAKISAVKGNRTTVGGLTASLILRSFVALIIAGVVVLSASVLATGICTEEVGYTIKHSSDGGVTYEDVYTHYYIDGEDTRFEKYENNDEYYKQLLRGNINDPKNPAMDDGQMAVVIWITQVCTLLAFVGLIYSVMWKAGDSEANRAELGHATLDKYKGIKAGLLANIPFMASYLILVITRAFDILPGFATFYKLFNGFALGINHTFLVMSDGNLVLSVGGAFGLLIGLLIIPVTAAVSYALGTKHIILKNKIMYK